MTRIATAVLAVAALLVAGCGGGSDQPVEGSTTPGAVTTTATTTPTAPTQPAKVDVAAQMAKLTPCIGGKPAETYKWFQPTVDYAKSLGGDGFTVTLGGKPVTLIAFPSPAAAQLGFKDITDRLIALQQKRPTDYGTVAATQSQVIANVLEVATAGAPTPKAGAKITTCVTSSTA
jgi:hypothetical protein